MTRKFLLAATVCCLSDAAVAAPISLNEAALARGFALPSLGQLPVPERGHLAQQFELDLVNEFFLDANQQESLETDGETTRLAWRGVYGVAPGWEVGMTIPLYFASGGFLDSSIEGWHRFFNLPNSNRADRPHNQVTYRYTRGEQTLLDVQDSANGFGDVRLQAGRALGETIALRAQLKLPTGSAAHLLGNSAWGTAVWVDYALPFDIGSRFDGFVSAGLGYTGTGDVLPQLQRHFVPFGAAGLSCRLFGAMGASLQYGVHGGLYRNSEMAPLKRLGAPLSFGLNYRLSPQTELEVLVQEDSSIYTSPDFVLHFALAMP